MSAVAEAGAALLGRRFRPDRRSRAAHRTLVVLGAGGLLAAAAARGGEPISKRCVHGRRVVVCAAGARPTESELREQLAAEADFLERAVSILGPAAETDLAVTLYSDREAKGIATGSVWEESSDRGGGIHRIADWQPDFMAEAEVLLGHLGYASGIDNLDRGLAIVLAGRWQGWELAEWAGRLSNAELLLEPSELVDPNPADRHSYLYAYPAAALRIQHRLELAGGWKAAAPRLVNGGLARWMSGPEPEGFVRWVRALAALRAPRAPRARRELSAFQRGICLAHSYTSLSSGYASRRAVEQMRYLRDRVHVGAVSITPFGYIAGADDPEIRHRERQRGAARLREESDEAVSATIENAHRLGLEVLLAPHLWGRVWCGEWGAGDPESWRRLFRSYEHFILHYALLAELRGAEMFQLGKELVRATRGREPEWRRIVARVRSVYSGRVTYGAHWDDEFERLGFVDALDFAGINAYAPLCAAGNCSEQELHAAAERHADRIERWSERWSKPVLLTEVGFPGAAHAAQRPWQDGDDAVDLELQAACYRAILEAFGRRSWCAGTFWWKWFTDPASHQTPKRASDFPPAGKPAESVLATAYERIARDRPTAARP